MQKTHLIIFISIFISILSFCTKVDFDELITNTGEDTESPIITISGANPLSWQINNTFIMPEVLAYDSIDGDLSDSVLIEGNVDTTDTGANYIYMEVSDKAGNTGYCTLTVNVVNTGPTLELLPPDTVKLSPGNIFKEPGFSAKSPDGAVDLNFAVKITYYNENDSLADSASIGLKLGSYKALYEVEYNAVSKRAWRHILVTNDDFLSPIITILGKNPDTLWTWESYHDSDAVAIDNVDDSVTVSIKDSVISGVEGVYKVYYSAIDFAGNKVDTFRTVVILKDITVPTIILSDDSIIVELNNSFNLPAITATDSIDGDLTSKIVKTGSVDSSKAGIYNIYLSVSDTTGNSVLDTLTVFVYNPPVINLLGNNPDSVLLGTVEYTDPGAYVTDNISDTITNIVGIGAVNTSEEGSYFLIYKYTDNDGNIADSIVRAIVVKDGVDSIPPVITVLDPGPDTIWIGESHNDSGATAIDNKDGQIDSLIITSDDIDSSIEGIYTITYIVSDAAGNSDTATKSVVVIADNEAPIITIEGTNPANINIGDEIPTVTVTALDNKDGNLTTSITSTGNIDNNKTGTYYIIYTVFDNAGNTATDTFTVTVGDNNSPIITIYNPNPDTIEYLETFNDSVKAVDDVDGDISASIKTTGLIDSSIIGEQYLYYEVSDAAGNLTYDTLKVVVVDLTAPVLTISGVNPVSIAVDASWTNPAATAIDNVDGDISGSISVSGNVNTATEGAYNVIYSISDASGNESKDTLVVNVTSSPDTENPVITISGANPDTVAFGSTYTYPTVTATDNVDGDLTASIVKTGNINTSSATTQTVIYSVTDVAGNDTSVTLTVVVKDLIAPQIIISGANPDTINYGSSYTEPTVSAVDDVDGDISGSISKNGTINSSTVGSQSIIYSVTDAAGNSAKDTLVVLVLDTVLPEIMIPGQNLDTIDFGASFTEPIVTASDNADGDITASIVKTGAVNTSLEGTYLITYEVSDVSGNSDKDTLKIVVKDISGPEITISGSNPLSVAEGGTYTEPAVTAIDNKDGDVSGNIVKSGDTVDPNTPGTYNVIFTVSDNAGNVSKDTLVVNVSDDSEAPTITIPGSNPLSVDSGSSFTEPTVTASDNIDGDVTADIVKSGDTVDPNTKGTYYLIYTVSDLAGNEAKDTLVVNVVSAGSGTTVYDQVTPPLADWIAYGSGDWHSMSISNEDSALKLSVAQWQNKLHKVSSKNGNTFSITSGKTYRVTFDVKNSGCNFTKLDVGLAVTNSTNYTTTTFAGTVSSGFTSNATYTSISVNIVASATGTYCIGFDIEQANDNLATDLFIKNLKIVEQ